MINLHSFIFFLCLGADPLLKNKKGQAPFDLIKDFDQWIEFISFENETRDLLRGNAFVLLLNFEIPYW